MATVEHEVNSVEDCKRKPLFLFYDCEAANSNIYTGDIIEIAAKCYPEIRTAEFESFISTSQDLAKFTVERCGIKMADLEGKPSFPEVFNKFLSWIQKLVRRVNKTTKNKHFPVLCAHGGFGFDFVMLLSNMKRHKMHQSVLKKTNLHFADTFAFCKELQAERVKELCEIRLSMDSLFSKFCPEIPFLNRHRAMGDVNAMVKIFSSEPLKTAMNKIDYATSESLCSWFETKYCAKEQKILLEDKMAKLDAYTKTVNLKKLVQIQLTYDGIQRIFENCCSFMDFYEAMKDLEIDRKTAKHFACQFGGMGLRNQGIEPYCSLPKSALADGEVLDFSLNDVDLLLEEEDRQRAVNVPPLPPNEFMLPESTESWDGEIDETRSFTFTVTKPEAALSLTVDDFVSDLPPKTTERKGKNSQHRREKSKAIDRVKDPNPDNQISLIDTNTTTTSYVTLSSRKHENVADVVRNSSASLQVGRIPNKQERYQLEKELLTRIRKAYEECNSEKEKIPGQSEKRMDEESVEDVLKTEKVSKTDSEKEKIVGQSKKRTDEKSAKDVLKIEEISVINSQKEKIPDQSEKRMDERSIEDVPRPEEIPGTDPTGHRSLVIPSNVNKPNTKETSQKDKLNKKKFPRKFKTPLLKNKSNNNNFQKQRMSSDNNQGKSIVTMLKRNKTPQNNTLGAVGTVPSAGKHDKHTVSLQEQVAVKEAETLPVNHYGGLINGKPSMYVSARGNVKSFESGVDSTATKQQGLTKKSVQNKRDPCKDKPANVQELNHNRTVPISKEHSRKQNVVQEGSIRSRKARTSSNMISTGSLVSHHCQPEADKEFKNKNGSGYHVASNQNVLKGALIKNKKLEHSDLNTKKEAERSSTCDLNIAVNNSGTETQEQVIPAAEETPRQLPVTHAEVYHSNKMLHVDKHEKKDTRGKQAKTRSKKETSESFVKKKDRERKSKLRRHKRNRKAVVFLNSSRDEEMKDWPRVEIFIGEIPIYVPCEPTDDNQNDGLSVNASVGFTQKDGRVEDQHRDEGINLGDIDQPLQVQDSAEPDGREDNNVQGIVFCQNPPQSNDQMNDSLSPKRSDVFMAANRDEGSTASVLHKDVLSPDGCIVEASSVESRNSVAPFTTECVKLNDFITPNPSSDECSADRLQNATHNKISTQMDTRVTMMKIETSQQTNESDMLWYHAREQGKKVADEEQQTDCAFYTTFNINTVSNEVQDKETLTDRSVSRARSSDTFSSFGDDDCYDNFQLLYESSSPPKSPAIQRDMYLYDVEAQCDINTEVYNADDNGYESPGSVFNISMSPHRQDINLDETRFPGEDTRHREENTPSLQYENGCYHHHDVWRENEYSQTPRSCLPRPNTFLNNPNVIPQSFLTYPCQHLPPLYQISPSHVPTPHVYPARFGPQYIPRHPNNLNVLPCQYSGPFNPWQQLNK